MIVIAIIWILFGVLFQSYSKTAELTLRIENEQKIMSEILFLNQYLDNISDNYKIDNNRYQEDNIDIQNDWSTSEILLKHKSNSERLRIYSDWECINIDNTILTGSIKDIRCSLFAESDSRLIEITDPEKIYFSKNIFKIKPAISYSWNIYLTVPIDKIIAEWFHLYWHAYSKHYTQNIRSLNVHIPVQTFFNIWN